MAKEEEEPPVTKELIEYLEMILPPKDLKPTDTRDEAMFYAGKRALINYLKTFL